MSSSMWHRLGALSGVASAALLAGHALLADPYDPATDPNPTRPSAVLAQALVDNRERARLGAYLGLAGVFLLIWFVGYLRRHLQQAEGEGAWLASVAHGGGLVAAGLVLVGVTFTLAESELASYGDDTQVAKTYFVYGWNAASALAPPFAALVAATTAAGFRYAAFPRWLNWFGLLITVLIAAMFAGMGGIAAAIALLWMAVLSIVLSLRAPGGARASA